MNKIVKELVNKIVKKKDDRDIIIGKVIEKMVKDFGYSKVPEAIKQKDYTYYPASDISPELWSAMERCRKEKEYQDLIEDYIKEEVKKFGGKK